jgi:hypothetical protein
MLCFLYSSVHFTTFSHRGKTLFKKKSITDVVSEFPSAAQQAIEAFSTREWVDAK